MTALSALIADLRRAAAERDRLAAETTDRTSPSSGDPLVVYFSSISGNTHKFVEKLSARSLRLPLRTHEEAPSSGSPTCWLCPPTAAPAARGSAPQVVKFLNLEENRRQLRGVLGAGNTNFGEHFCLAAQKIAVKCDAPLLYRFELMGTEQDVANVNEGLMKLWQ